LPNRKPLADTSAELGSPSDVIIKFVNPQDSLSAGSLRFEVN